MKPSRIVTTSWDDGNDADLKLADCLRSRRLRGTFYIPLQYTERTLTDGHLRDLASEGFEIGAHGFSHKLLRGLSDDELTNEVSPCKPALEDVIGNEVQMFCYPCGRYDSRVIRALRAFGYRGGRTTRMLGTHPQSHSFEMPTTVQAFPHVPFTYLKNTAKGGKFEYFRALIAQRTCLGNWVELSKGLFDTVLENGGAWHLYGHSWEIERLGLWDGLREVLDYVSGHEGVQYMTNGELVAARETISAN